MCASLLPLATLASLSVNGLLCAPVEPNVIQVDGLTSDWRGVRVNVYASKKNIVAGRANWRGAEDGSFRVACNHTKETLYLAISVVDDFFVRSKRRRRDDHLELTLGRQKFTLYPGNLKQHRGHLTATPPRTPADLRFREALTKSGYQLEIQMPLAAIHGYRSGTRQVPFSVRLIDWDHEMRRPAQISSGATWIVFAQQAADRNAFLEAFGLKPADIHWQQEADFVGSETLEQILLAKTLLGVLGGDLLHGRYLYLQLPLQKPGDIKQTKLIALGEHGKKGLFIRYQQLIEGVIREFGAIYQFDRSSRLIRSWLHELSQREGKRTIVNRLRFHRQADETLVVVDEAKSKGFDQDNYRIPRIDEVPGVLVPWVLPAKQIFACGLSGCEMRGTIQKFRTVPSTIPLSARDRHEAPSNSR